MTGLRIARENGLVATPDTNPLAPRRGNTPPPHRHPRDAVLLAGRALGGIQHASGAFHEANIHQPVHVFDGMTGIPGVPLKESADFPELESPITLRATARGLSSFVQIGHILGEGALRSYARNMIAAKKVLDAQMDEVVQGDFEHVGAGGLGWLGLLLPLTDTGPHMEAAPKDLLSSAREVVMKQFIEIKGHWRVGGGHWIFYPTVWREQSRVLPERDKIKHDFREPFVWLQIPEEGLNEFYNKLKSSHAGFEREVSTAVALWILAAEE